MCAQTFCEQCGHDIGFIFIGNRAKNICIFDVFTDQQVVDLVSSVPPEYASIILRDYAYLAGSNDNLTAVVVYFKR